MNKQIVIFGPTAVGKTKLAARLAYRFNGEIISADSRQVYIGMNIGTGKDYADYVVEGEKISYHLIDVFEPTEEYNLVRFIEDYNTAFTKIISSNKIPFLTGGTMLFIDAILSGYELKKVNFENAKKKYEKFTDEQLREKLLKVSSRLHNTTDLTDRERMIKALVIAEENDERIISPIKSNSLNICILPKRKIIYRRIDERLSKRLKNGMIEEVENLVKSGISFSKLEFFGLEYRYISKYLKGELNYNDMKQKLASAIKNFAKRQITWIRKIEKKGTPILFFYSPDEKEISVAVQNFLNER